MFYIDTSSLLKLLIPEPESAAVQAAVAAEDVVLVSVLTELEAAVFRIKSNGKLDRTTLVPTPTPVDIEFGPLA